MMRFLSISLLLLKSVSADGGEAKVLKRFGSHVMAADLNEHQPVKHVSVKHISFRASDTRRLDAEKELVLRMSDEAEMSIGLQRAQDFRRIEGCGLKSMEGEALTAVVTGCDGDERYVTIGGLGSWMVDSEDGSFQLQESTLDEDDQTDVVELPPADDDDAVQIALMRLEREAAAAGGIFGGLFDSLFEEPVELSNMNCATGQGARGKSFGSGGDDTFEDCAKRCGRTENCVAFDYTEDDKGDACRFYRSVQGARSDGGHDDRVFCQPKNLLADDGCFRLSRGQCCAYVDGRPSWQGQRCVPAKDGTTFKSGAQCEPDGWVTRERQWSNAGECLAENFAMEIRYYYDRSMLEKYGSHDEVHDRILDIHMHAEVKLTHQSSGRKVFVEVKALPVFYDVRTQAARDGPLPDFRDWLRRRGVCDSEIAFHHLITAKGNDNIAGIAYIGTACHTRCSSSGITEDGRLITNTASVLTHELGHNLGMRHVFDEVHAGRQCMGYMSYGRDQRVATAWSACSHDDWTADYDDFRSTMGQRRADKCFKPWKRAEDALKQAGDALNQLGSHLVPQGADDKIEDPATTYYPPAKNKECEHAMNTWCREATPYTFARYGDDVHSSGNLKWRCYSFGAVSKDTYTVKTPPADAPNCGNNGLPDVETLCYNHWTRDAQLRNILDTYAECQ